MDKKYVPSGILQGDTSPMPDRGISTGVTDTYGANLSGTNRIGSLGNAAKSDPMFEHAAEDPTLGPAPGDAAEDSKEKS